MKAKNKFKSCTDDIYLDTIDPFPSEIQSYSYNVENSIFSIIKLNTPLKEIINDKFFGIKRSFPRKLFYIKIYAFSYVQNYKEIEFDKYKFKIFPQTNFNISFHNTILNINSKGTLSILNNNKNNNSNYSYPIYENDLVDNNIIKYKVGIDKKDYFFVIIINNNIEMDGILKSEKSFRLINTFKCKLLYFKENNKSLNFMFNSNNSIDYTINKNSIVLLDIKSAYSISDLKSQIIFHDDVLNNLFTSSNENIKNIYYFFILTNKDKNKEKESMLNDFLKKIKFKLNVAILLLENSSVCGQDFNVVIDKEYLVANINNELVELKKKQGNVEERLEKVEGRLENVEGRLENVEGRLENVEGRLGKVEDALGSINKILCEIQENMLTKSSLKQLKDELVVDIKNSLNEEIRNNDNNSRGILAYIKGLFNGFGWH